MPMMPLVLVLFIVSGNGGISLDQKAQNLVIFLMGLRHISQIFENTAKSIFEGTSVNITTRGEHHDKE